ncbi:NADH-quinone oxidoreductase subunit N [Streptomyces hainanensis]|uniref:NADH-quinone oxidoreductase subunit N n=1 Tax=Streptomyces hainanensis TaxID=402648 RepID=A0A4R4T267_9ACTN|nr:proton-conducting transporter membrane subunit [Streptomyces hainanensis]TDC70777.1 NADH-quinone oxidoreductase subunit N [Streptomyces hainanensis]
MTGTAGTDENPLALLPELLLAGSAVLGLLLGSWLPRHRQWPVGLLAAFACLAGIVAAAVQAGVAAPTTAFGGAFAIDTVTTTARIVVLGGTLPLLALVAGATGGHRRETECYVLVQLAALGALTLAGAADLLTLAAAYLLASVPGYALAGFAADGRGTEAALKYFVVGALLGGLMFGGVTLLLAAGRTTGYPALREALPGAPGGLVAVGLVGLLAGLLFKSGAVPGHFWVPDAVQGCRPPVAALLTTLPKAGALAALFRLATGPLAGVAAADVPWSALLAALAAATMTLGNLAAFFQDDVRRLLAYSTISQAGYLLVPVAVAGRSELSERALLYYLAGYALTNLGAFAVVCALPGARTVDDYRGLARRRPALVGALLLCLLGLVGTPPTAVFLGKLEVFGAAVDGGYAWLAALAVANTVASLFYYLRWLAPALLGPPAAARHGPAVRSAAVTAYTTALGSLALGLAGGPVLTLLGG